MRKIIAFFIRFPIWTNVLMFSLLGFGVLSFGQMKYAFFPEMPPDFIFVQVPFPGASPEEVEEGVVLKIEENLEGIDGVERVTSVSRENMGQVSVEVRKGADLDKVLTEVKNAVDRITSFPRDAERPTIYEQQGRTFAISFVLFGDSDLYNLKTLAEELRDDLLATEEISQVTLQGVPELEMSIEVSEADLRRYGLTFNEIRNAVSAENINISGGKFETKDEEILIRAYGREYYAAELEKLVVRGNPDGTAIRLRDVATVKEQWEDSPNRTYYNGRNAVIVSVDKTLDEDILAIVKRAKQVMADYAAKHPQIGVEVLRDQTISLRQRIDLLTRNGILGLLLVVFIVGFFMNLRLSFWVSMGIPISFAGMFLIAGMIPITINVISLFGMIIVIGILVDDAIVVGENIYAHYENGSPPLKAAVDGTVEMLAPVTTSVLTTVIAFTPFFFLDGFLGKFIWHMAVVVIACLIFSLVEAFFILPAHLAHSKGLHPHAEDNPVRKAIDGFIHFMTHRIYSPLLRLALRYKWVTVIAPVSGLLITIGLVRGGFIGMTYFPYIDRDSVPINLTLVSGRQESDTKAFLDRIEQAAWEVNAELKAQRADGKDVILSVRQDVGSNDLGDSGSHAGKVTLELLDGETRDMSSREIARFVQQRVGLIPEAQQLTYGRTGFFGKPISISLLGNDIEQLMRAKDLLVAELEAFETLKDVTDSNQEGRREINIQLKPRAESLGLTLSDIAGQVRQGFFGQEIQRIQRGTDEIRVWVRYRPEDRMSLKDLDQMRIRTPDGAAYPFSELATYTIDRGIVTINHLDKKREIKVEADQVDVKDDLPEIMKTIKTDVIPRVLAQVSGVTVSFEGQSRNQQKTSRSMQRAFPLALISMFILVILVFRSYLQAALIFSLIPAGIIGAFWGHGIQGIQVNMLSLYGIIALSGIIINDSIVFVDQINRNLRKGIQLFDAVHSAGISRLRPIILTTATTAAGLAPLILEKSRQAQFLIPMAVSVAYGLVFGTVILLFILPAGFMVLNRFRIIAAYLVEGWRRLTWNDYQPKRITAENVEPHVRELAVRDDFYLIPDQPPEELELNEEERQLMEAGS